MDRPSPAEYQPALTTWARAWRFLAMLAISAVVWASTIEDQLTHHLWWFAADLVLGVASFVLVRWRRSHPLAVALVTAVFSSVSGLAGGPATLAVVSLATRRHWRSSLAGFGVNFAAAQVYTTLQPGQHTSEPLWLLTLLNLLVVGALVGWGMYIGSRRELVWTLRHRAERAESEQELRVEHAREHERARIAREMHDVLAHRISQISLHAGALSFREDLTADQMRASAGVIREKAHEALTDLRGVLGVLRDPGTGEPVDRPQPTYADLAGLVEEARAGGLAVEYDDLLDRDGGVPDSVGRTLYRIVQEGITNARKHAPGARLTIRVSGSPDDGVDIMLRNPLGFASRTPGAGLGLVGLTERAQLRGGRLEHRRDGSTFVLHGWIPWAA